MKTSNEKFIPIDFSPVDEQYRQFTDTFDVNLSKKKNKKSTLLFLNFSLHFQF